MALFDGWKAGRAVRAATAARVAELRAGVGTGDTADRLAKVAEAAHNKAAERMLAAETKNMEREVSKQIKKIKNPGLLHEMGEHGVFKALRHRAGKVALIAAIGGTAVGGLVYLTSSGKKKFDARDHLNDPLPSLQPVAQPQEFVSGPAEGRGITEWQDRMRGQQQAVGPMQPTPDVGAEAQNLVAPVR